MNDNLKDIEDILTILNPKVRLRCMKLITECIASKDDYDKGYDEGYKVGEEAGYKKGKAVGRLAATNEIRHKLIGMLD